MHKFEEQDMILMIQRSDPQPAALFELATFSQANKALFLTSSEECSFPFVQLVQDSLWDQQEGHVVDRRAINNCVDEHDVPTSAEQPGFPTCKVSIEA